MSASPSSTPSGTAGPFGFSELCRATGTFEADTRIETTDRYVEVHRPATAPARGALVIVLHGNGAKASTGAQMTGLSDAADEVGFSVVYPYGEELIWGIQLTDPQFGRDAKLMGSIVDTMVGQGCVDPGRVFLAGFSLGGILAHTLACTDAAHFHVIVEVSSRDVCEPCAPSKPVTFVAYSSMQDQIIPYGGGSRFGWKLSSAEGWAAAWAARNRCSGGPITADSNERLDRLEWTGCGAPTVFYRIKGGYHVWFGGDPPIGGLSAEDTDPSETVLRLVAGQAP